MRSSIAMSALIDDEGTTERILIDFIGAEQKYNVDIACSSCRYDLARALAAFARQSTDVEAADARGRRVQEGKSVPAILDDAIGNCCLVDGGEHRRAIGPGKRAPADDVHGLEVASAGRFDHRRHR